MEYFAVVQMADVEPVPDDNERLAALVEEMKNKANEFFKGTNPWAAA